MNADVRCPQQRHPSPVTDMSNLVWKFFLLISNCKGGEAMKEKVKFVAGCLFVLIAVLFLFPGQVSALDFTIKDVRIEARLLENGDAEVKETFTYSFEDDFNGIARTLIPKEGSKITGLKASEKGKNLRVEKEGDTYYIHRKGSEETVVID